MYLFLCPCGGKKYMHWMWEFVCVIKMCRSNFSLIDGHKTVYIILKLQATIYELQAWILTLFFRLSWLVISRFAKYDSYSIAWKVATWCIEFDEFPVFQSVELWEMLILMDWSIKAVLCVALVVSVYSMSLRWFVKRTASRGADTVDCEL